MKLKRNRLLLVVSGLLIVGLLLFQILVVVPTANRVRQINDHGTYQQNVDALKRDPNDVMAHEELGFHYSARENWPQAELHWREAVRIEPGNRSSQFFLATMLRREMKTDEALQVFKKIVAEDKSDEYGKMAAKMIGKLEEKRSDK